MARGQSLQDPFLNALRKERVPVSIYLVKGIKLQGQIDSFDQFVVLLCNQRVTRSLCRRTSSCTVVERLRDAHRRSNRAAVDQTARGLDRRGRGVARHGGGDDRDRWRRLRVYEGAGRARAVHAQSPRNCRRVLAVGLVARYGSCCDAWSRPRGSQLARPGLSRARFASGRRAQR